MDKKVLSIFLLAMLLTGSIGVASAFSDNMGGPKGRFQFDLRKRVNIALGGVSPFRLQGKKKRPFTPVLRPIMVGHGFAIQDEEFHVLSLNVIRTKRVIPSDIRDLLRQNKTLEEIVSELRGNGRPFIYKGILKFGEDHYRLNITEANKSYLDADIIELPTRPGGFGEKVSIDETTLENVGHITLEMKGYEGVRVGTGSLTMEDETYKLLLTMIPNRKEIPRIGRNPNFPRMAEPRVPEGP